MDASPTNSTAVAQRQGCQRFEGHQKAATLRWSPPAILKRCQALVERFER
jgi:hypothetical protein